MENMARTDQSLQNSKQELTTTIAHLVDTIEEMHTSFGVFMPIIVGDDLAEVFSIPLPSLQSSP